MAIQFNASSENMQLASAMSGVTHSYCFYVRPDDAFPDGCPFQLDDNGSGSEYIGLEFQNFDGSMRLNDFESGVGGNQWDTGVNIAVSSAWTFVAVSKSGANLEFYHKALNAVSLTNASDTNANDPTPTHMGFNTGVLGGGNGIWTIAGFRAWDNTVLTQTEFNTEADSSDFSAVKSGDYVDYRFASGALTTDSSGNARTLTQGGSPTFVADPVVTSGGGGSNALPLILNYEG